MRTLRLSAIVCLLLLAGMRGAAGAAEEEQIKPPFGLPWGESEEHLAKLLQGAKATIVEKHDIGGCEAWTVEGLIQQNLRRTVFYFKDGRLVEVELQYQSADWDTAKYDDFMSQVRQRIEKKFGTGQLIARSKRPEGSVMQTIVGYKWTRGTASLELIYYAAENADLIYRTVSVHYKSR